MRVQVWGLAAAALAVGCGPQSNPKGHGAGGEPLKVLAKGQNSFVRVYKLSAEQQKRFEAMHRKFADVAQPKPGLDAAAQARLDAVRQRWEGVKFAVPAENRRLRHTVTFDTEAGEVMFAFFESAPDHNRNFLAQAAAKQFDGKKLVVGAGWLGFSAAAAPGQDAFTLRRIRCPEKAVPAMALYAVPAGDRDAGESYRLATEPLLDMGGKTTIVGVLVSSDPPTQMERLVKAAKEKGGLTLRSASVGESPAGLFLDAGDVTLAKVDAAGEIVLSDTAQFVEARAGVSLQAGRKAADPHAGHDHGPTPKPLHEAPKPKAEAPKPDAKK